MTDDDLLITLAEAIKTNAAVKAAIARIRADAFAAGEQSMREKILQIAADPGTANKPSFPIGVSATASVGTLSASNISAAPARAPRGSVGRAIKTVLEAAPGASITEIEQAVIAIEPEIAIKSVGNELRRLEGIKYRRDREGGYKWFLLDEQEGGATDVEASAADLQLDDGGSDDAAP